MSRLRKAWRTVTEGTSRTVRWAFGGMRSRGDESGADAKPAAAEGPQGEQSPDEGKGWGERIADRLGHRPRTIALAAGGILLAFAWIGWTAYVWSEHGSTAGLGVLISWPAVLAAVMLVTAPLVGGALAVRRHRAGEPFAGAAVPATEEANPKPEPKAGGTEDETDDDGSDGDEPDDDGSDVESEDDETEESEDDEADEAEEAGEAGKDAKDAGGWKPAGAKAAEDAAADEAGDPSD